MLTIPKERFGWKKGEGLGREKQGNVDSLEVVEKFDRGGLGFIPQASAFQDRKHSVDLNKFIPHHQEFKFLAYEGIESFKGYRMEVTLVKDTLLEFTFLATLFYGPLS